MKKLLLILFCLSILVAPAFAQAPRLRHGETDPISALPFYQYDWLKEWTNPHAVYLFNGYGATLLPGHVVMVKPMVKIDSIARVDASDTLTIADSLKTFHWWKIRVKSLNPTTGGTIRINGLDTNYVAICETLAVHTGEDSISYSVNFFRKLNLVAIYGLAANDSTVVYAVPHMTVTATLGAASATVIGVVADTSLVDTYAKVYVSGICQAYLTGGATEVIPGVYLETSSTAGYGQVNATAVTAKRLGRALEAGKTAKLYWIWLNP